MKVKELITQLLDFDQDAEIVMTLDHDNYKEISMCWSSPAEGMKKKDSTKIYLEPKGYGMEDFPTLDIAKMRFNDSNFTFMELYRNGAVKESDIDVYIDEWHEGISSVTLQNFIGMNDEEWSSYLTGVNLSELK